MCLAWMYLYGICSASWIDMFMPFTNLGTFSANTSSDIYLVSLSSLLSSPGTFMTWTLALLFLFHTSLGFFSFCSSPFSLCCSDWVVSIDLSWHSLILSLLHSTIELIQGVFYFANCIFQFYNFHLALFYNFFFFAEICYFCICFKRIPNCLLETFNNFSIWFMSILVSVDCLFSLMLWFSWF